MLLAKNHYLDATHVIDHDSQIEYVKAYGLAHKINVINNNKSIYYHNYTIEPELPEHLLQGLHHSGCELEPLRHEDEGGHLGPGLAAAYKSVQD